MTVLLKRVLWYRLKDRQTELVSDNIYQDPIDITDDVNWSAGKGLDVKNNVLTLNLKNSNSKYITDGDLQFEEQDQIKVFLKYTDDNDDLTSAWDEDSSTEPDSSDLVSVFYVIELGVNHSERSTTIRITCADKTYVLFNKLYAKNYLVSDTVSAAAIVQDVVRFSCQNQFGQYIGTGANDGVYYDIDAKLVSEGGYIEDTRTNRTVFPDVAISKVWKPIYEWIQDLSQTEKTNSAAEVAADTLVQKRAMIFWVDENNKFHWVYPTDTVTNTLVVGTDDILNISLNKKVFDVVNMVIFNAGTDMYGTGIWNYVVDTTSTVRTLKMRVIPMVDITEALMQKDYTLILPASRDAGEGGKGNGYPIPQFPTSYPPASNAFVPTTSFVAASNISDDGDYNDALRERATQEGQARAQATLSRLANARWVGTVNLIGTLTHSPGDLIQLTDAETGINAESLRCMDVKHSVTKNGWFTTLSLEADSEEQ